MGENEDDRIGLIATLASLDPHPESVPINALVRVGGTPLDGTPALDPLEVRGDLAGAELARRALPARLDPQEARVERRDLDDARRVVEDGEPARAEPRARARHVLEVEANVELRAEAEKLGVQEEEYRRSQAQGDLTDMATDLGRLRVFTGLSEVSGPGVELRVTAEIKPEYVQDLINELRNAGAEAIAVNGERIVANSPVTTYKNRTVVNETMVEAPLEARSRISGSRAEEPRRWNSGRSCSWSRIISIM